MLTKYWRTVDILLTLLIYFWHCWQCVNNVDKVYKVHNVDNINKMVNDDNVDNNYNADNVYWGKLKTISFNGWQNLQSVTDWLSNMDSRDASTSRNCPKCPLVSPPSASVNGGGQLPWQVLGTLGTSYRSSCLIIITLQPNRLRIAVSRRLHFFQRALQIN